MFLTILAWVVIIVFLTLIISKKMQPSTALVLIPIVFALFGALGSQYTELVAEAEETPVTDTTIWDQVRIIDDWTAAGLKTTFTTTIILLFAIPFFSATLNVGLSDPVTEFIIRLAGGDPVKVLVDTAVVAAMVSLDGDGITATLIVRTALIPVYQKPGLKIMDLGALTVLMSTIMNLLSWGGPTTRVVSVLGEVSEQSVLDALLPGMGVTIVYVLGVTYYLGLKEHKRVGIQHLNHEEIEAPIKPATPEEETLKCPKLIRINAILTAGAVVMLVLGTFPSVFIFLVGTALAVLINYRSIKDQKARISDNTGGALQVSILVMATGIFMGLSTNSGMPDALAFSVIHLILEQVGRWWGPVTVVISAPGTFSLSNDAFHYGVLPVFAETGYRYGYTALGLDTASLLGQAFHLLSPLVTFVYLLLNLARLDMGERQKQCAKWAISIFIIFIAIAAIIRSVPLFK